MRGKEENKKFRLLTGGKSKVDGGLVVRVEDQENFN